MKFLDYIFSEGESKKDDFSKIIDERDKEMLEKVKALRDVATRVTQRHKRKPDANL